jgi:hypothetical protein
VRSGLDPTTDYDSIGARPDRFNSPFTITADHLDDGDPRRERNLDLEASIDRSDSLLDFARPSARGAGQTALNLVDEAADVFRRRMEDHARETEEKLRLAEMRAEAAERTQSELVIEADRKLQDASKALAQAQSRIEAQEDRLVAAEFRAQVAEVEARDAKQALALVEEAIRRRLLCTNPTADAGKLEPVSHSDPSQVAGRGLGSQSSLHQTVIAI